MTVAEALAAIRRVGTVAAAGDKVRLRIPARLEAELRPAIEVLRQRKADAIALLGLSKAHTIDPETGIWPIAEWGSECGRGFVGPSRGRKAARKRIPGAVDA